MPVTVRSTATASGSAFPLVLSKPAGTASGDLLLAFLTVSQSATVTPPSGWTSLGNIFNDTVQTFAYYKVAGSGEPSSYSFASSSSVINVVGSLLAMQGGDVPEDAQTASSSTAPAVTTLGPDRLVLVAWGVDSSTAPTPPGGTTSQTGVTSAGAAQATAGETFPSAGGTGTFTATGPGGYASFTVAVPPAPTPSASGSTTLFLAGFAALNNNATLFIDGARPQGSIPLVIRGKALASGSAPLFVDGGANTSGSAPLVVTGVGSGRHYLPLVVRTDPAPAGSLTLFTSGSTQPNAVGHAPLYVQGGVFTLTHSLPLSLRAVDVGSYHRGLNLWVGGRAGQASGWAPLFVCNTRQGLTGWAPLFLQVDGTLLGGQAAQRAMNLFLKRPFEAGIPLFLQAPGTPLTWSAPLYVRGASPVANSVTLAVPSTLGGLQGVGKLFTSGW